MILVFREILPSLRDFADAVTEAQAAGDTEDARR